MVSEALRCSGQRGVIATGWGGMVASDLPENVFQVKPFLTIGYSPKSPPSFIMAVQGQQPPDCVPGSLQ
jgi:hypothetical protein